MKAGLPLRIAWRYLRAPKSHTAVSAISAVAVTGVAVATAAIVCVLSVFNGFRDLLNQHLDTLAPDVTVSPLTGKTFSDGDSIAGLLREMPGVEIAMPVVADNALIIAEGREMPVKLKGVDLQAYPQLTSVNSLLFEEGADVSRFDPKEAVVSVGVAKRVGIYNEGVPILLFAPRRIGRVNLANPAASFISDSLRVGGVFQAMQSDYDENTVIVDIGVARDLFQYEEEATSIEIKGSSGTDAAKLARQIEEMLPEYVVKDRLEQQEMNFRMVSIEKWVTFLLLIFILLIASFNIISTLCMIILDKQNSLGVLSALGMRKRGVGMTFAWESMLVALAGGVGGIALGIVLCLIQQHFGIIKLAGDRESLILDAYPVVVEALDIALTLVPVVAIGLITAAVASRFAIGRTPSVR